MSQGCHAKISASQANKALQATVSLRNSDVWLVVVSLVSDGIAIGAGQRSVRNWGGQFCSEEHHEDSQGRARVPTGYEICDDAKTRRRRSSKMIYAFRRLHASLGDSHWCGAGFASAVTAVCQPVGDADLHRLRRTAGLAQIETSITLTSGCGPNGDEFRMVVARARSRCTTASKRRNVPSDSFHPFGRGAWCTSKRMPSRPPWARRYWPQSWWTRASSSCRSVQLSATLISVATLASLAFPLKRRSGSFSSATCGSRSIE